MKRFADNLASFALVIVIMLGVGLFVPALREVLWGLAVFFWTIIKAFFLQDIVQKLLKIKGYRDFSYCNGTDNFG